MDPTRIKKAFWRYVGGDLSIQSPLLAPKVIHGSTRNTLNLKEKIRDLTTNQFVLSAYKGEIQETHRENQSEL